MLVDESLLRRHVCESNLIEEIVAHPSDPLYEGHLVAARIAARGKILHPNRLHRALARRVPELRMQGGKYRMCGIEVGGNIMPHSKHVPMLMEHWLSLVREYQSATENFEESARFLHAWFLCIHPYIDGNGRTARLIWNMLRINKGLSWVIEEAKNRHSYYARIREIEIGVFKKRHPDVYE